MGAIAGGRDGHRTVGDCLCMEGELPSPSIPGPADNMELIPEE